MTGLGDSQKAAKIAKGAKIAKRTEHPSRTKGTSGLEENFWVSGGRRGSASLMT